MMNNLRITVIANQQEQILINNELNAAFQQPQITYYASQDEFEKSVKLYNNDFLIAQDALVNRGFYTQFSPFLELTKIPLLILKDADSQSFKNHVVRELVKDPDGDYLKQLPIHVSQLINEQLTLSGQNKILFLEDEEIDITFIKRKFIKLNPQYECDVVSSIEELRAQVGKKKYDLIVSDFNLPDGTAFDSIAIAKAADIPIVIATGQGSEKTAVELMKAGAADYLIKDKNMGEHMLILPSIVKSVLNYKKLEAYNSGLLEMLRLKNQDLERFAHIIAHDLRSPIASCVLLINTLQMLGEDLSEDLQETMQMLTQVSYNMTNTIEGIYQYTVTDSQTDAFVKVDMKKAAEEALGNLQNKVNECGAVVTIEGMPEIDANYVQMVQLFQNLMGNGIKYRGNKTPELTVRSFEQGNEQIFAVSDNGIGIAKENHKKIFEIFSRLHNSSGQYEGVGMGLTIVKRILERHQGRIWVESDLGEGTTFFFALKAA
ncbi:response regulator receiver domain-containing protein [Mucilaginibacter yixingensis]|uniref:histidine kinase n=1 Tax=Mucilaginibacter yixingensis TaxID=1295612 RepID=A0A2T5JDB2_9SPHI|nr:hybrid sensor histidine kinase/response regulator [Mucilaginibacter yixingensis]PTQ99744.1 response regulator receiver domain-containing protein [Mucilaginibacter yixingensis]